MKNKISELICTRINHDIIGNIGAVANAVELLEEGDLDFIDDIRSILNTSSKVLTARLKFFRLAFGLDNPSQDIDSVCKITQDYLDTIGNSSHPIKLKMNLQDNKLYKVAMLSSMIVSDTLVKGGEIKITENNNGLEIISNNNGINAKEKASTIRDAISGMGVENSAQLAPIFYLQELLINMGYKIHISDSDSLSFKVG